jgi:chromosome segregation protein
MLSGGERSLTAIALLFAVINYAPPPFLVLDEIDAALDESNSRKLAKLLKEMAHQGIQFILITHNRAVMEEADVLYGVTMADGISKIFSLKFKEAEELAEQISE